MPPTTDPLQDARFLKVSVGVNSAPMDIHWVVLAPPRAGSDVWTLTVSTTDDLDRLVREGVRLGPGDRLPERRVTLTEGQVAPIFRMLSGAHLPVQPPYTGGLDGDSFKVAFSCGHTSAEFAWWGHVPPGWEPLGAVIDAVLALAGEPGWARSLPPAGPPSHA